MKAEKCQDIQGEKRKISTKGIHISTSKYTAILHFLFALSSAEKMNKHENSVNLTKVDFYLFIRKIGSQRYICVKLSIMWTIYKITAFRKIKERLIVIIRSSGRAKKRRNAEKTRI